MSQQKVVIFLGVVAIAFTGMVSAQVVDFNSCTQSVQAAGEKYRQDLTQNVNALMTSMSSNGMNFIPQKELTAQLTELQTTASELGNFSNGFDMAKTMANISKLGSIQMSIGRLFMRTDTPLAMYTSYMKFLGQLFTMNSQMATSIPTACAPRSFRVIEN